MTETQRNIKAYQQMLPGLKERVLAVAVLLVVSMTMMISASFAWITLSRAPEVSMITTTVAANGNLEIALADPEGQIPNESAVGDSAAAPGMNLVSANITWGNLVNLSDASYGLNQIDLRPALLSGFNLNTTPLYGATYSADGRVKDVSATYQYASWKQAEDGRWYFAAGKDATYGVRAISSVKFENITGNAAMTTMLNKVRTAYAAANTEYLNLINGTTLVDENKKISCMDALAMLLEVFVNEKAESKTTSGGDVYYDYSSTVTYTYRLLLKYQDIMDAEGEALLLLANLQAYANNAELGTAYFKSIDELMAASSATLTKLGVKLESLATYKSDCANLQSAINGMEPFAIAHDPDTGTSTDIVYWSDSVVIDGATVKVDGIGKHVNKLVDINTVTINGKSLANLGVSDALGLLSGTLNVVIKGGVIKNTEQRLGDMLKSQKIQVTINISVMSLGRKTANVTTAAASPFLSNNDLGYAGSLEATGQGDAVSLDTYGLAIDLWLRTNAEDSLLVLEGNIIEEEQEATCIDKNGNETALYVAKNADGSAEVYMLSGEDGTEVYDRVSHTLMGYQSEMMTEEGGGYTFERKTVMVVVGYEGENRVWEDWKEMLEAGLIDENSTTQGAGSCYVFYANPSDQTRILDMLKAFTIAFIDQNGNHVATAKLDTEHHYAINGKVTVPMMLTSGMTYEDEDGIEQVAISAMPRSTPMWLTAVVYLDGMNLTNEHVLAAGEIEGRLNIQFGTLNRKDAVKNLELQQKYRTVSAIASYGDKVSTNAEEIIEFEYDGNAKDITVTLAVDGDQPTNVSAFFIRSVGSSQGTRTESVDFERQNNGTWQATFSLNKPGSYSLRTVMLDGVEYVLDQTPAISISGLSVTSVRCTPESGMIMTADQFVDVAVEAVINADPDLMPKQVRALFRSTTGKEFSAIMSYNAENEIWEGLARINTSGTYTLQYLVMDGDYTELTKSDDPLKNQQKTLIVTLGMKAVVTCTGITDGEGTAVQNTNFKFEKAPYTIGITVKIFDDSGNPIRNLDNVVLYYGLEGGQTDQDGMYHKLEWDESHDRYKGHMQMVNAGTYRFNRLAVVIDESLSNIRSAPGAPVFESAPPEPPRMDMNMSRNGTQAYQFVPGTTATMSFNMYYAQAADVYAVIENVYTGKQTVVKSNAKEMLVHPTDPNDANYYRFYFDVPLTERGNSYSGGVYQEVQDGEWVIKEIWLQKVYDKDTNYYAPDVEETTGLPAADKCLVFDVYDESKTAQENAYTYVVQTVRYNVAKGTDTKYTGETMTGIFMETHTVSGVSVELYDWNKAPLHDANVTLKVTHNGDTRDKGGYTTTTAYPETLWTLTNSDGSTLYSAGNLSLQFAGTYRVHLCYTIGEGSEQRFADVITLVVKSATPTVTITGVTPGTSESVPTEITYSVKTTAWVIKSLEYKLQANKTSELDTANNSVKVYAKAATSGAENLGTGDAGFVRPTLTFTVAGVDGSSTIKFVIPAGDSEVKNVTITGNSSSTVTLGLTAQYYSYKGTGVTYDVRKYLGHGDVTISEVTITRGSDTFTVYLDKPIKIYNPSSINH